MTIIRCPSCSGGFEVADESLGLKTTLVCPLCRRVVVARDGGIVTPGVAEGTVPFDPGTNAALEPATAADEPTAIGMKVPLSLPTGKRVSLAILSGPRKGHVVVLDRPRVVLGRDGSGADVEVADPEMSRAHAALECHGPRVVVRDLGSRNGTFVGSDRVEARDLEDRGEFRLGQSVFMLVVSDE